MSLSTLFAACRSADPAAIHGILTARPSLVNETDEFSSTALVIATDTGNPDIINIILDYGADIDAQAGSGATALHCAVVGGHSKAVQTLLRRAPKIDIRNHAGKTAIQCARKSDIKGLLLEVLLFISYAQVCLLT